jgi:ABC-type transporter MlaC component
VPLDADMGLPHLPPRKRASIIVAHMPRILLMLLLAVVLTAVAAAETPHRHVSETVRSLAELVSACRLPLAADPVALRGVVDQNLRPNVDVLYAGQLILGRHWSDASPEQRRRFGESLYGTLAGRYASGLLLLTDSNVVVVPAAVPPQEGEAVVEIRIQARFATPIPADAARQHALARLRRALGGPVVRVEPAAGVFAGDPARWTGGGDSAARGVGRATGGHARGA